MSNAKKVFIGLLGLGTLLAILGVGAAVSIYFYLSPQLPPVEQLRDVKLQTPLRIYTADAHLIAEYGEKRRSPLQYDQVPKSFIQAVLAAEDSRFYEHHGVDIKGLARAALQLLTTGKIQSGGSTITMQVAKNYFLTRDRTFIRKFSEILLALQIERELSKQEILELYFNKIYLGNRAYGIQAAAQVYYGRTIDQLTLAELAMIAGLPKAPSAYNPLANPSRALERRNWILGRMLSLAYIDESAHAAAISAPVTAAYHGADIDAQAPYLAEMVRSELYEKYGEELYTEGFKVYTTLSAPLQKAANQALQQGLIDYDQRHGYRGPERQLANLSSEEQLEELGRTPTYASLEPALVSAAAEDSLSVTRKNGEPLTIEWDGLKWARPFKNANQRGPLPKKASDIAQPGDLIRIQPLAEDRWRLAQLPEVQGALVSLSPRNGAIQALVGGFDYSHSKFNRATQATRQPGSNFKPFVYTAALDNGFTPASIINDAPVVFEDRNLESSWRPENYSKKFFGPTRLREALYKSRNLVSIRILRSLGVKPTLGYLERFGFSPDRLPNNLSLALGTADVTPLELATAYASFANQGFKVNPFFIQRIEDINGKILFQAHPQSVCDNCTYVAPEPLPGEVDDLKADTSKTLTPVAAIAAKTAAAGELQGRQITHDPLAPRVLDERTVYLINNIMQDVIKRGTGRKAQTLQRSDLAGKTGTTNDQKDAWFSGFNQHLVTSVWIGFDQPATLGRREFGSTAALPVWIDYMAEALRDVPETTTPPPEKIVSVRIDPQTGLLAYPGQEDAIFELFREENVPTQTATQGTTGKNAAAAENLF